MSILNELTIKNLKLNKKRTIVTIVGIILSTALMVGIGLLFSSFQDYMIRETISYNGKYEAEYNDISLAKLNDIEKNDFDYFYQKKLTQDIAHEFYHIRNESFGNRPYTVLCFLLFQSHLLNEVCLVFGQGKAPLDQCLHRLTVCRKKLNHSLPHNEFL